MARSQNAFGKAAAAPKRMMQLRVDAELHTWLKVKAAEEQTTMTDIIVRILCKLRDKEVIKVPGI